MLDRWEVKAAELPLLLLQRCLDTVAVAAYLIRATCSLHGWMEAQRRPFLHSWLAGNEIAHFIALHYDWWWSFLFVCFFPKCAVFQMCQVKQIQQIWKGTNWWVRSTRICPCLRCRNAVQVRAKPWSQVCGIVIFHCSQCVGLTLLADTLHFELVLVSGRTGLSLWWLERLSFFLFSSYSLFSSVRK